MSTYRGVIRSIKFAKVPTALKDMAFMLNLEIELNVDKHWLFETTRFTVTGNDSNLLRFKETLANAIKEYTNG